MRAFLSPSTIEEKKKRENVSSSLLHRIHRNVSERERGTIILVQSSIQYL